MITKDISFGEVDEIITSHPLEGYKRGGTLVESLGSNLET